jgi:hypothetical protein
MARYGPVTTDTQTVPLGLAQIRVGASATNIGSRNAVLTSSDSIGVCTTTKFAGNTDWFKLESGFPLMEDTVFPIREGASLECAFQQLTPKNLAFAYGLDATTGYTNVHSGEVALGARSAPAFVRMEAHYTFPTVTYSLDVIFPRAQISSSVELDFQSEAPAAVTITFESKNASSDVTGGNAIWNAAPLGRIQWNGA